MTTNDDRALRLSVVAPCHNEEDCLREFHRRVTGAARLSVGKDYELVLLNDGSRDTTWAIMQELAASDPHVVAINLARNHGHQLALTAGLTFCRGARVLCIDADLQDQPELLAQMWAMMDAQNADVIYGQRRARAGETAFKRGTAKLFYRLLRKVGHADIPVDSGDFRLMTRRVVDTLNAMPEQSRFIRGMVSWIGFKQLPLLYDRDARYAGETSYSMARMIALALDAITSFSIVPLRVASYAGLALGLVSLLMVIYTLGSWLSGDVVDGWTSLTTIVLVIGSVQLFLFGLLGEYVGRLYLEAKHRPLFVIDRIVTQGGVRPATVPPRVSAAEPHRVIVPQPRPAPGLESAAKDAHISRNGDVEQG